MNTGPITPDRVAEMIRAGLPGATVQVESDDNTHFGARIVATRGEEPLASGVEAARTRGRSVKPLH